MKTAEPKLVPAIIVWLLGMAGVMALSVTTLPELLRGQELPLPMSVLIAISAAQSGVLLALAVLGGVAFGPKLGLGSIVARTVSTPPRLILTLVTGCIGGACGIAVLLGAAHFAPMEMQLLPMKVPQIPLLTRILYGGITEEILIRFGLMSVLAWGGWKLFGAFNIKGQDFPVIIAIVGSALGFGAGHLPALVAFGGELTGSVVGYTLFWNGLFGIVAGVLYWKVNIEAAMLAHVIAHLGAYVVMGQKCDITNP